MEEKRLTPMKAIRAKCLDCSCWNVNEVRMCPIHDCPLYPYRDGHNPARKGMGNSSGLEKARFAKMNNLSTDDVQASNH